MNPFFSVAILNYYERLSRFYTSDDKIQVSRLVECSVVAHLVKPYLNSFSGKSIALLWRVITVSYKYI